MKLSVCIPIYNGENCLEEALNSLKSQTRLPDEVIIRDDCSTDNGSEVIKKFNDLNIDFSRNNENLGCTGNWNKCLQESSGDIVTFLHQDDGFEPRFLENLEKDFQNNMNKIGMWYCNTHIKDTQSHASDKTSRLQSGQESIRNIFTWDEAPAPTGVSFKVATLKDIGFYDPKYKIACEPDLYFRIVLGGYSIYKSEENLVWRTLPPTRATNTFGGTERYYSEWMMFLEDHSSNSNLVDKNMINRALFNFYNHTSSSIISNITRLRFSEVTGTLRIIFSRARKFEEKYGVRSMNYIKFFALLIKSMTKIFYLFVRRNLALAYRRIK